jgi:hypothetical protein
MEVKSNQGDVQDTGPGKWLGNLVLLLSQIPDSSRLIKIIRTSVDEQQCIVNILVQNLTSDEPIGLIELVAVVRFSKAFCLTAFNNDYY